MTRFAWISRIFGVALGLVCGASAGHAQNAKDWTRVTGRDAILVSQAIGWSLEGPVSAAQAAPVVFAPGVAPKPIATGTMYLHNVMLIDTATRQGKPSLRGLVGVIELADRADRRVLARFATAYEVAAGSYRVATVEVHAFYPDTPRLEAYFVPAGANIPAQSPYAMLETVRRLAVDPAATADSAPRAYRVFVFGMDRLSPQADLGFVAVNADNGREMARAQSRRENGWIVASAAVTLAVNGKGGVYFPVFYRPNGTAGPQRIVTMFSSHSERGAPAAGAGTTVAMPNVAAPLPALSPLGQSFMAKGFANQGAQP